MKKLFLMLLISVCGLMASAATKYEINVGGVEVTSDNCSNIAPASNNNITGGYAVYNPSTNTLTCYSITIRRTGTGDYGIHNRKRDNLTIVFKGNCRVATADCALNLARSTTIVLDEGCNADVLTGGSTHALNLGSYTYYIKGTGHLGVDGKNAIHGNGSGSTTVYFQAKVAALSTAKNHVLESFKAVFNEGAELTIYANSQMTSVNNVSMYFNGRETVLSPYGAYYSNSAIYTSSGSQVTSQDIYISDQYVAKLSSDYFPDANFRYYLSTQFPKGYITTSDVNATTSLNASSEYISSLRGLEYFTKLVNFACEENNLTSLPALPSTLKTLNCRENKLTSLPSMPSGLTLLVCDHNQLTSLPTFTSSLQTLECENNKLSGTVNLCNLSGLKTLKISNNPNMTSLDCSQNSLTTLEVDGCTALVSLFCGNNQLTSLDVSGLSNLIQLECARNKLSSINVSNKTKLKTLNVCKNQLSTINVKGCSAMEVLNCYDNVLTSVSVQGCSSLMRINISLNQIKESAMGTLINSLRTILGGSGEIDVYYEGNDPREGNVITNAQVKEARAKLWIPMKCVNATWVEIPAAGDVNGDGKVNVSDVTSLVNMILGVIPKDFTSGDINGDGKVNVSDVTALVNLILGVQ